AGLPTRQIRGGRSTTTGWTATMATAPWPPLGCRTRSDRRRLGGSTRLSKGSRAPRLHSEGEPQAPLLGHAPPRGAPPIEPVLVARMVRRSASRCQDDGPGVPERGLGAGFTAPRTVERAPS